MGGHGNDRTRKGREPASGGGDVGGGYSQGGTLGRDQLLVKEPKKLLVKGKIQKNTKAYAMKHK